MIELACLLWEVRSTFFCNKISIDVYSQAQSEIDSMARSKGSNLNELVKILVIKNMDTY